MSNPVLNVAAWFAQVLPASIKTSIYRLKPLATFVRNLLNWVAPRGLSQVTIAAGGLKGSQMILDMQSEKDYWLGTYEPGLEETIVEMARPGIVAYDLGANIGYVTLLLARKIGRDGKVFAFEALPANFARMVKNVELNNLSSVVIPIEAAVVDSSRSIKFLVGPSGGMGKVEGSAGRQGYSYMDTINVRGIALDDFVYREGNPAPQVVKIDIEGGEVLAFPGMSRVLLESRPLVLLELHGPVAAKIAWQALTSAGYQICHMQPGYPAIPSWETLDWKSYVVAIPMELS